jgi:hypothetical protein
MPTANLYQRIPGLMHGISKQSPTIRYPGQVADSLNVNFNIVDGARKRSSTKHVAFISGATYNQQYRLHRIERDDAEEYLVVCGSAGYIRVIDVNTGTVVTPTVTTAASQYLSYGGAKAENLRFVTVADNTFIANTLRPTATSNNGVSINANTMPVRMQRTTTSPLTFSIDVCTWKDRPFYRQVIKAGTTLPTTGTFRMTYLGDLTPTNVPWNANSKQVEECLTGNGLDPDDYPDDAIEGIRSIVRGKIIVTGGPLPEKPIYIDFSPDLNVSSLISISSGTMNGSAYTVSRGEDFTQPAPKFITEGRKISDVGYFRNRLILCSDDFVFFSATDDIFNLFKERADLLTDADPIEVQLSANDVTIVDHVVPYRRSVLVLTRAGQQFEVTSGDVFGPGQVAVSPSTRYSTKNIRPVAVGERIYLLGDHPSKTLLYEYFYSDTAVSNIAADVTKHVDDLLPADVIGMDASANSDMVCCIARPKADDIERIVISAQTGNWSASTTWVGDVPPQPYDTAIITSGHTVTLDSYPAPAPKGTLPASYVYVYRSYNVGNERKQSAWSVWQFGTDNIQDAKIIDDELFILRRDDDQASGTSGIFVEKMNLTDESSPQEGWTNQVQVDQYRMFSAGQGTYNAGGNYTSWNLGYYNAAIDTCVFDDFTTAAATHVNGTIRVTGNHSAKKVILGRNYDAFIELSEVIFRSEDRPITDGRTMLHKLVVDHVNSGKYTVDVTRTPGISTSTAFVPTGGFDDSGLHTCWVSTQANRCVIKLTSDTVLPVTWSGVEYHGTFATLREYKQ